MENEILWKWELLCEDFEQAKQNYIQHFSPLINNLSAVTQHCQCNTNLSQIKSAEAAWNRWIEIQMKLREFAENDR